MSAKNKISKPKTYVTIVLDRSGSMSSIRTQAVQNYNEQVQQMKENSKDQDIYCSLITFNGSVFEHLWNEPADKLEEADNDSYQPNGGTALFDGMGYAIRKLQETTTPDDNTAYLMVIISDGEENSSSQYNSSSIREMVEACQKTNKWTFSYMGCSEAYLKRVSEQTSIPMSNMAVWSNRDAASASFGFAEAQNRNKRYYDDRTRGITSSDSLYSDAKGLCANFDPNAQVGTPADAASRVSPDWVTPGTPVDMFKYTPPTPNWNYQAGSVTGVVDPNLLNGAQNVVATKVPFGGTQTRSNLSGRNGVFDTGSPVTFSS